MDFAIYIIKDRSITNKQLFDDLAKDMEMKDFALSALSNLAEDLLGENVYDPFLTEKKLGINGIGIKGKMVDALTITNAYEWRDYYKYVNFVGKSDGVEKTLITINVKGKLSHPSLIEGKLPCTKFKDMSKVMAWSSLPIKVPKLTERENNDLKKFAVQSEPSAAKRLDAYMMRDYIFKTIKEQNRELETEDVFDEDLAGLPNLLDPDDTVVKTFDFTDKYKKKSNGQYEQDLEKYADWYYRRVLIVVRTNEEQRFRAILHDAVWCDSYIEDYSGTDGDGTFTLEMKSRKESIFDAVIKGPTFAWNFLSTIGFAGSMVGNLNKAAAKMTGTIDKVAGTHYSDDYKKAGGWLNTFSKGTKMVTNSSSYTIDGVTEAFGDIRENEGIADDLETKVNKAIANKKELDERTEKWSADDKTEFNTIYPDYKNMTQEQKKAALDEFNALKAAQNPDPDKKAAEELKKNIEAAKEYAKQNEKLSNYEKAQLDAVPGFKDLKPSEKNAYMNTMFNKEKDAMLNNMSKDELDDFKKVNTNFDSASPAEQLDMLKKDQVDKMMKNQLTPENQRALYDKYPKFNEMSSSQQLEILETNKF